MKRTLGPAEQKKLECFSALTHENGRYNLEQVLTALFPRRAKTMALGMFRVFRARIKECGIILSVDTLKRTEPHEREATRFAHQLAERLQRGFDEAGYDRTPIARSSSAWAARERYQDAVLARRARHTSRATRQDAAVEIAV